MGQDPLNPRPDVPGQPQPGPGGPPGQSFGQPTGPGYGYQGPQGPSSYPTPGQAPGQPSPYAQPGEQMPYGSSPYGPPPGAGRPVQPQSYPFPGPGQPYGPGGRQPGAPAAKKKGRGLLVGLVVGALTLVLVIGGVVVFVLTNATPASTEPDKATRSTAALQGYLDALAAGDADKAKRYGMNAPGDSPLLTNDFLKAMVTKSPVTEIQVDTQNDVGTTAYVAASYKLGGTLVQGEYQLTKVAKIWKLNSVVSTVDRPSYWGTLGVTVNGATAPTTMLSLFPGVYELGTGTSLLAFPQTSFTVKSPDDYVSGLSTSEPALTDAGKKGMVAKAQAWLNQCLAAQDTNPKDCGMNTPLPSGATLAPGSLKRTVDAATAPFADATPRVSLDDPQKITMTSYVSIKVTAADTAGNTYSGTTSVSSAEGTIDGENITVVFTE